MLNSLITASPPNSLLVTSTVHVLGWALLVGLVVVPAVVLVVSALRDALAARPRPGRGGGSQRSHALCAASG